MNPEIEKLRKERADNEQEITVLQRREARIKNRISYLEQGERKKRAHRLITRGAAVESVEPLTKKLTETEFYEFIEKAFALPEVKAELMRSVNAHNRREGTS